MTRVALDTNVLVYAELQPDRDKGRRARDVVLAAAGDGVICAQVFAEFIRVVQREDPARLVRVQALVGDYLKFYTAPPTTTDVVRAAAELSTTHRVQLFDAIVIKASADAGAKVLLSEDMQDGRSIAGLRILNPFNPDNAAAVDALFPA